MEASNDKLIAQDHKVIMLREALPESHHDSPEKSETPTSLNAFGI